jgi:hypothetical protein
VVLAVNLVVVALVVVVVLPVVVVETFDDIVVLNVTFVIGPIHVGAVTVKTLVV